MGRTYPRADNEYPEIMSNVDPLIVRVSPTVLLVSTVSYTASITLGQNFKGFRIYASGVGLPIYKEAVDISKESTDNTVTGEGSDAWNYVVSKARDWLDVLEQNLITGAQEVNYLKLIYEQLIALNGKIDGINNQMAETNLNLYSIDSRLSSITNALANDICSAIITGYGNVSDAINYQSQRVDQMIVDIGDIGNTTNSIELTANSLKATIGNSTDADSSTLFGRANDTSNKIGSEETVWSGVTTGDTLFKSTARLREMLGHGGSDTSDGSIYAYSKQMWDRLDAVSYQGNWQNPEDGAVYGPTWTVKTPYYPQQPT